MSRSIPIQGEWDGNDPEWRRPPADGKTRYEHFSHTDVVAAAWTRTPENYQRERGVPKYLLSDRGDYFQNLRSQITRSMVAKVEDVAKKQFAKFDRYKTILTPEILSQGLTAAVAILDSEIAKLAANREGLDVLDPRDKERLAKIESEMLEAVSLLEGSPSATLRQALEDKGRRLQSQEMAIRERTVSKFLQFFKTELERNFREKI